MLQIHLHNLRFFGQHGLYEEERLTGTFYTVNATVELEPVSAVQALNQTVDYVQAYTVIKNAMQQPTGLLEVLADNIITGIKALDVQITRVSVTILKEQPPVPQLQSGSFGVTLEKKFS